MKKSDSPIYEAFDPELFRQQGHHLIDRLADHLEKSLSKELKKVLPNISPDAMLDKWTGDFLPGPSEEFEKIAEEVLTLSNNLHSPGYIGHQCATPLPISALGELIATFINNGSAVYEMGPVNVAMEKRLVEWMCNLIGYSKDADGVFTHGGSVGNLTALLAARQSKANADVWKYGLSNAEPMTVLVSTECHYSVKRAVGVMGLGEEAVALVPVDKNYHMDLRKARECYLEATHKGRLVTTIVGNACSTATGTYDDLEAIADFARDHDLWFHVDAAHGASALLSDKYRHLLKGIRRADSVVWDAHKMLMIPALATGVLFKNGAESYRPFSQKASYLFEKDPLDEWYNYAHRTLECTKTAMGIKIYVALKVFGTDLFRDFVDYTFDLAANFSDVIKQSSDFELGCEPSSNIICFRYVDPQAPDLDELQRKIRSAIIGSEEFYIVQTQLETGFYLRLTIINPHTTIDDLKRLLDAIRTVARV